MTLSQTTTLPTTGHLLRLFWSGQFKWRDYITWPYRLSLGPIPGSNLIQLYEKDTRLDISSNFFGWKTVIIYLNLHLHMCRSPYKTWELIMRLFIWQSHCWDWIQVLQLLVQCTFLYPMLLLQLHCHIWKHLSNSHPDSLSRLSSLII